MTDAKPVMLGYFVETFLMNANQKEQNRQRLLAFAEGKLHVMPGIYVEELPTRPAAIKALIEAVHRDQVKAVAIIGAASMELRYLDELAAAGAKVLIADPPP